ncbi:MAG: hypothetical protein LBU16_08015 [Treponema sp.]|jgi:hypothetical protein|nr:hypothetical protein [Treponema sp.]
MRKRVAVFALVLSATFSLSAQDHGWDEFGYDDFEYDWDAEIEEPSDFVDPYAPAPDPAPIAPMPAAPAPAAPASAPPEPAAAEPETAEAPFPETPSGPEPNILEGDYYRIYSDSGDEDAALLLKEMELRMDFYNRLFRFDKEGIAGPLQVRSIADAAAYEAYVGTLLDQTPPGAVYLHYSLPEKRELVINRGSDAEAAMVAHQSFIQYLRAFVPNPPAWMRDGFAIVFSSLRFDPAAGELAQDENLAWLDTVKKLGNGAPPPQAILLADAEEHAGGSIDNFKPLSWALASFFLNYDAENYFRALTEMFMVLSPDASAAENSRAAARRLTLWTDFESLAEDYQNYLDGKKSFAELIEAGRQAYSRGDFEAAEQHFARARSMRPDHAVPCYYQGLLAYGAKNFAQAEELYNAALYNGADAALVHYALGLNAVSAGRAADGIRWLEQAAAAAPDRFGEKADSIISRLR